MNFFEIAYFGINENFFMGIFHGMLFSFPFSIPFLICFRYFIFNGWFTGLSSFLGTILGQIVFFVFLCSGTRPLIQFWYTLEPLFTFLGIGLAFQIGTEFYHQRGSLLSLQNTSSNPAWALPVLSKNNDRSLLDGQTSSTEGRISSRDASALLNRFYQSVQNVIQQVGFILSSSGKAYGNTGFTNQSVEIFSYLKIFCVQFLFIFLNPIFPALSTRIILSQDILIHYSFLYILGFFVGSITFVAGVIIFGVIGFSILSTGWQISLDRLSTGKAHAGGRITSGGGIAGSIDNMRSSVMLGMAESGPNFVKEESISRKYRSSGFNNIFSSINSALLNRFTFPQLKTDEAFAMNNFFVFSIVGFVLHGSIQYTWRFITQYPMEFFPVNFNILASSDGFSKVENKKLTSLSSLPGMTEGLNSPTESLGPTWSEAARSQTTREFPTQDSNIRHREKILPVERHVPIERINARRTLSGRPALNEEQKSDAYIKYNSFFLNKIEHSFEDLKMKLRENKAALKAWIPDSATLYPESAKRIELESASSLDFMKNFYIKYFGKLDSMSGTGMAGSTMSYTGFAREKLDQTFSILKNPNFTILNKNNTKGKPKFSYIRNLYLTSADIIETGGLRSGEAHAEPNKASVSANPYIHDDISFYDRLVNLENVSGIREADRAGYDQS